MPAAGVTCGGNEQPLQWNVRGAAGPPGPAGPASIAALRGTACTTVSGLPGVLVVRTEAGGVVTFTCLPAPPSEAPPNVVLNEIDYDQAGADGGGFVELYNAGLSAAELDGLALVFVDGADGAEYLRKPLTGSLDPGAYLVVPVDPQNGSPDGVALYDTALRGVVEALSPTKGRSSARSSGCSPTRSSRVTAAGGRRRLGHGHRIAGADPQRQRHE